jgi:hypothetical protein
MRHFAAILVVVGVASAAPIPKSLKAKRPLDITGMWKLVEHNSSGRPSSIENMIRYWKFTDDGFEYYSDPSTKQGNSPTKLETPDPNTPEVKLMHKNSCRFDRNGDRMVWVYASDANTVLENCDPGSGRYQYVFELVK